MAYPQRLVSRFQREIDDAGVVQFRVDQTPRKTSVVLREFGTTIILCMALRRGDSVIGVQSAEFRGRHELFDELGVRIARGMAQLASLALETARFEEPTAPTG
jgi:hypothetical protein